MPDSLLLAAFFSGASVFIGLFAGFRSHLSERTRALLLCAASGILLYVFVRVASRGAGELANILNSAVAGYPAWGEFWARSFIFLAGIAAGLGGMMIFDWMAAGGRDALQPPEQGKKVSLIIAGSCGYFHLLQGLVLGVGFAWGEYSLIALLAVCFALYNASEGLAISFPLAGVYPGAGHLATVGLTATLPSLIGVLLGFSWSVKAAEAFFWALASGAVLANISGIFRAGRRIKIREEWAVGLGIGGGFVVAWVVEMITVAKTGVF